MGHRVYDGVQLIRPSQTFTHLHGNSGVTDLRCHGDDVFSCGRNGRYCQLSVANGNQLQLVSSNKVDVSSFLIGCRERQLSVAELFVFLSERCEQ